ncbi:MAG: response regulator [Variibacter sp.]|nr:response regulator [Variibacter sp.]
MGVKDAKDAGRTGPDRVGDQRDAAQGPEPKARMAARILIIEDEFLLALMLEEDLRSMGFSTVGPFTDLAGAREALLNEAFDLVVLDINLNGEMVFSLADELLARRIPFVFLTGYDLFNLPERLRGAPRVSKPYDRAVLQREIQRVLSASDFV